MEDEEEDADEVPVSRSCTGPRGRTVLHTAVLASSDLRGHDAAPLSSSIGAVLVPIPPPSLLPSHPHPHWFLRAAMEGSRRKLSHPNKRR